MFSVVKEPTDGETRKWDVYSLEVKTTALFTPTRMIMDGESLEYVFNGNSLFVVHGNDYERGSIELISEDAFVWRMETDKNDPSYVFTGDYCALFLRSNVE